MKLLCCGYQLEAPCQGTSNEYNVCFVDKYVKTCADKSALSGTMFLNNEVGIHKTFFSYFSRITSFHGDLRKNISTFFLWNKITP